MRVCVAVWCVCVRVYAFIVVACTARTSSNEPVAMKSNCRSSNDPWSGAKEFARNDEWRGSVASANTGPSLGENESTNFPGSTFEIFRFAIPEFFFYFCKMFLKNMLVRYRGINDKGVLERPGTKWMVLRAISSTLKCQFTGKC